MKRAFGSGLILSLAGAACILGLASTAARADILFQDPFNYPDGNLTSNGGWYSHSGAGAKAIQISSGKITVVQSTGSGEDDNHPFYVNQLGSSKTYVAFKLTLSPGSVMGSATDYFLHFRPAPTDTNGFVTRVFLGPPTAGGDYNIGVSSGAIGSTPGATWGTGLTFGTTYKVVAAYDGSTGGSQLWINPVNEASTNVNTGASATVVGKPLASLAVRQSSPTGATDSQVIDDVVVATNFADAAAGPFAPALPTWAIPVVALLLASIGAVVLLRRRNAVA